MTGREMPHDIDAERSTLGGMLQSRHAVDEVAEFLTASDFYEPRHEYVFSAITEVHGEGRTADAVTVADRLSRRGELGKVGGPPYLHDLLEASTSGASAGFHGEIVRDLATLRAVAEAGTRIAQMGYQTERSDAGEIVERAQAEALGLSRRRDEAAEISNHEVAEQVLDDIENGTTPGLMTGFTDFDHLTGGLLPGQLVIIAARPGMGKSCSVLDIFRDVSVNHGLHTMLFSLEMSRKVVIRRMLAAQAKVPLHHLKHGSMCDADWARVSKHLAEVSGAPIHIDDRRGLTVSQIGAAARRQAKKHPLAALGIDYLQLVKGPAGRDMPREREVALTSQDLRALGQELNVPVIALCQLNRGPEQRSDKKPMLSDLRESGALEQDADIVILLHREAAYDPESPRAGEADWIVAKHRDGPTATITLAFQGHYSRFVNMADDSPRGDWSPSAAAAAAR